MRCVMGTLGAFYGRQHFDPQSGSPFNFFQSADACAGGEGLASKNPDVKRLSSALTSSPSLVAQKLVLRWPSSAIARYVEL